MKVDPPELDQLKCGNHSYSWEFLEDQSVIIVVCEACGDVKLYTMQELNRQKA